MATISVPNDFQNNTTADADGVDANFAAVTDFVQSQVIHVDGDNAMTAELPLVDGSVAASQLYVDNRVPALGMGSKQIVVGTTVFSYSGFPNLDSQTETFGTTFTAAPNVFLSFEAINASTGSTVAYTSGVTTTQMVVNLNMDANFSDSPQTFVVSWLAIGEVA